MSKVHKYFDRSEFLCNGNKKGICSCGFATVDIELLSVLVDVREHFKKPVKVYSGCRCDIYNRHVGGAKHSKHKQGIASDIAVEGVSPRTVYKYLIKKYPMNYGIGSYRNFTHIDVRQTKARW